MPRYSRIWACLRRAALPGLLEKVIAVKTFQQRRFSHTYADLLLSARYGAASRYFLDELYGPNDFTTRDVQAASRSRTRPRTPDRADAGHRCASRSHHAPAAAAQRPSSHARPSARRGTVRAAALARERIRHLPGDERRGGVHRAHRLARTGIRSRTLRSEHPRLCRRFVDGSALAGLPSAQAEFE